MILADTNTRKIGQTLNVLKIIIGSRSSFRCRRKEDPQTKKTIKKVKLKLIKIMYLSQSAVQFLVE